jgi:prepilin-type N-terminal cleavage/methylation domain-containing protein
VSQKNINLQSIIHNLQSTPRGFTILRLRSGCQTLSLSKGFTIVELLVVIVVIGVLAVITTISYAGVTNKANIALIQSDLVNAAKYLEVFKLTSPSEDYPVTINCAVANSDTNLCIESSGPTVYSYVPLNDTTHKSFRLTATINNLAYYVTNTISPTVVSAPIVTEPTVADITTTTATLGANIVSDGGSNITEYGTCWGTAPNPTTNCSAISQLGALTPMNPARISATNYPKGIAVSNDGTSVYYVNSGSGTSRIRKLVREPSTGKLSSGTSYNIGAYSYSDRVIVSSDGNSVYVLNPYFYNISVFSRNPNSGDLSVLDSAIIATDERPRDITISADGTSVYAVSPNKISMYSRNSDTSILTALNPGTIDTVFSPGRIRVSFDGSTVYVTGSDSISVYKRDTNDGTLTAYDSVVINGAGAIDISPDDRWVYVGAGARIYMFNRNPSDGTLTSLSPAYIATGGSNTIYGMIVSPDGNSIYTIHRSPDEIKMFSRNPNTGLLTAMNPATIVAGYQSPWDISISPDGTSVYVTDYNPGNISMYTRTTLLPIGIFIQPRTAFPASTTIYYRGYATNAIGTGYSPDGSFTTN